MELKNPKMMLIGLAVFALINVAWIYLYTLVGLNFTRIFDPMFFINIFKDLTWIPLLLFTGFLIAASIFVARFFAALISNAEKMIMVLAGVAIPIVVGLFLFSNLLVFAVTMLFYMLGCVLSISGESAGGVLSKFSSGYNVSKKVINIVAIGSLVASLLFFYTNLEDSQAKFKEGIVGIQSQLNVGSFMTKDDVRNMVLSSGSIMTEDQIRDLLVNQAATSSGMSADVIRANPAFMATIDGNATAIYQNQLQTLDQQVDRAYAQLANSSSTSMRPLMESLLSRPPMKYIIDFMPLLSAIAVASIVSFFGMAWIAPMGALMGALMPNREEEKKK